MAIELDINSTKFVLFNIYMPYQAPENEDLYYERLGWIKCFLDELHCTNFAVIGDWNANLGNSGTMTFKAPMVEFCTENDLLISSHLLLPETSYTHMHSYQGSLHYSWLDHIVSSQNFHNCISNIVIHYDMCDDDHLPVSLDVRVDLLPTFSNDSNNIAARIKWDNISESNINLYYECTNANLGSIPLPVTTLCCGDTACGEESHRVQLDIFFNNIVKALQASNKHLVKQNNHKFNKPGWSDYVSDLYDFSRETYCTWLDNGKPRQGIIYSIYTQSRRRFKYALRFIKKHENELRKEAIAKKYCDNNPRAMWKEVNAINNNKVPLPSTIENVSGSGEILKLWKNH